MFRIEFYEPDEFPSVALGPYTPDVEDAQGAKALALTDPCPTAEPSTQTPLLRLAQKALPTKTEAKAAAKKAAPAKKAAAKKAPAKAALK
ncbi:hypothetical protein [Variovorax atrisoli]|uniref:hypothetical protein n=1 Tax=Variovorax atrisoli TaxID=3394203 RepID=UPI000BFF662C|nr:hypothetical protein [Variovorax paradoxus]